MFTPQMPVDRTLLLFGSLREGLLWRRYGARQAGLGPPGAPFWL